MMTLLDFMDRVIKRRFMVGITLTYVLTSELGKNPVWVPCDKMPNCWDLYPTLRINKKTQPLGFRLKKKEQREHPLFSDELIDIWVVSYYAGKDKNGNDVESAGFAICPYPSPSPKEEEQRAFNTALMLCGYILREFNQPENHRF